MKKHISEKKNLKSSENRIMKMKDMTDQSLNLY